MGGPISPRAGSGGDPNTLCEAVRKLFSSALRRLHARRSAERLGSVKLASRSRASRSVNRWSGQSPASRSPKRGVGPNYTGSATTKLRTSSIHFGPSCHMNQPAAPAHATWRGATKASRTHVAPCRSWNLRSEAGVVDLLKLESFRTEPKLPRKIKQKWTVKN